MHWFHYSVNGERERTNDLNVVTVEETTQQTTKDAYSMKKIQEKFLPPIREHTTAQPYP